jgi:hypothetical protein
MKFRLVLLFLMIGSVGYSQMEFTNVFLKSGEKLTNVMAKLKAHTLKYKENEDAKTKEIEFTAIDYITSNGKTIRFFDTDEYNPSGQARPIAVEHLVAGKVELYSVTATYNNIGGMNGMGTGASSQSVATYYVKKAADKKLTTLGPYSPLTNNLKQRVLDYFSDCAALTDKIKNSELRVRDGLEKIAQFYNANCGAK